MTEHSSPRCHPIVALSLTLILAAIALAAVWPLPLHLSDSLPTVAAYSTSLSDNDPAMFCWNLWWTAGWLKGEHALMDCQMLHHPFGISLACHTLSPANGFLAWPITTTFGCIPAHNCLIVFHALLTAFATFFLARAFSSHRWAAVLAAIVFTWQPTRLLHAGFHLNLASTGWLVLSLLFLTLSIKNSRWYWVFPAGLLAACTGFSSRQLFLFLAMTAPIIAMAAPGNASIRKRFGHLLLVLIIALTLLLPVILPLIQTNPDIALRDRSEKETYSIPPIHHVIPPVNSPVLGQQLQQFYAHRPGNVIESTGYLGIAVMILALCVILFGHAADRWIVAGAVVFVILSWGPTLHLANLSLRLPYRFLESVPGISSGRTPGRFLIPAGLLLALAFSRCVSLYRQRVPGIMVFMTSLAVIEFCPGPMALIPTQPFLTQIESILPPPHIAPASDLNRSADHPIHSTGILVIPNDWTNRSLLLAQTIHKRPITTGFIARLPGTVFQRIDGIPGLQILSSPPEKSLPAFQEMLDTPDTHTICRLRDLLDVSIICDIFGNRTDMYMPVCNQSDFPPAPEGYFLDRWVGPENWGDRFESVYWGTWPEARLRIIGHRNITGDSIRLTCRLLAARQSDDRAVNLEIISESGLLHRLDIRHTMGWTPLDVEIPVKDPDSPYMDIWFRFSIGTAPVELPGSESTDKRRLAVAITQLHLE